MEKLKLDTETPAAGVRPKGLGMVSCVGTEYVSFKSPLPLDNKVCRIDRVKVTLLNWPTPAWQKMLCQSHTGHEHAAQHCSPHVCILDFPLDASMLQKANCMVGCARLRST